MDCLETRIKVLNLEVIDLQCQFNELIDNDFFNFDQAVDDKVDMLIKEINRLSCTNHAPNYHYLPK